MKILALILIFGILFVAFTKANPSGNRQNNERRGRQSGRIRKFHDSCKPTCTEESRAFQFLVKSDQDCPDLATGQRGWKRSVIKPWQFCDQEVRF